MKIKLYNSLHNTSSTVKLKSGRLLNSEVKRIRNDLCTEAQCKCHENPLYTYGPQKDLYRFNLTIEVNPPTLTTNEVVRRNIWILPDPDF